MSYAQAYARALNDPQGFWGEAALALHWERRWDRVLDDSRPPFYRWFTGGRLNTCYNALDRHLAERAHQPALIHDSPVTGSISTLTFAELKDEVARCAGALRKYGVGPGDRVIIYMPMVPEAVIAMLACARLGAIHSVVFGGFAAHELATRIDDAKPKLILSASCGIEAGRVVPYKPLLDAAIAQATHKPERCIVLQRPQCEADLQAGRDLVWQDVVPAAAPADCVPVDADRSALHPLHLGHHRPAQGRGARQRRPCRGAALDHAERLRRPPGRGFLGGLGRRLGGRPQLHLLRAAAERQHHGDLRGQAGRHPDPGAFWRVIAQHGVVALFTAPTAFRAIKKEDPSGAHLQGHDLARFRTLFLAGERCDPDTLRWAEEKLARPVIDHWWQTETGWPMAANCWGIEHLPVKPGSPTKAVPGYDVRVLSEEGAEMPAGEIGTIVVRLPLPPGTLPTLWQADQRYVDAYLARFPGYYLTGDAGYRDEDGYLFVMSRIDDVINVAGHRLSTGAMEEVLSAHPDVAECAVFGVADDLKGELPLGLVVLKAGAARPEEQIRAELIQSVRHAIGPVAAFRLVTVVQRLPKTRSGKILRGTMKSIADGKPYRVPATIDDPAILAEIEAALQRMGYAGGVAAS